MNKKWGVLVSFLSILVIGIGVLWIYNYKQSVSAAGSVSDEMQVMINQAKNADFVIVEIVPYKGMGEIGYAVNGCEPIDIEWACIKGNQGTITSFGNNNKVTPWQVKESEYEQFKVLSETKYCKDKFENDAWNLITDATTQEVYYECSQSYVENTDVFRKKCLPGFGDKKIAVITVTPEELNTAAHAGNFELIEDADLFYIFGKDHQSGDITNLWKNYSDEGRSSTSLSKTFGENDIEWPVAIALFDQIVIKESRAALIMDVCLYNEMPSGSKRLVATKQFTRDPLDHYIQSAHTNGTTDGSNNNIYKLCLMLHQRNPQEFHEIFIKTGLISDTGCYSLQNGDGAKYWNLTTFLPTKKNGAKAQMEDWNALGINTTGGDNISVVDNIYTFNGENCLTAQFEELNINKSNPYVADLFSYINDSSIINTSPSKAVEFILQNKENKKAILAKTSMKVLELQPCNDFNLENSEFVKRLRNQGVMVEVVRQTTAEFIGRMEDINSMYDMIYMGTNTGGFNTDANGNTQYNDINLNGKKYLHVGDLIQCQGLSDKKAWALRGLIPSSNERYRYSGNDITNKKKLELESYVDAGYPLFLSDELYNLNTIAIDDSSNIYSFVSSQKARHNIQPLEDYDKPYLATKGYNKMVSLVDKAKTKLIITSAPREYNAAYNAGTGKLQMEYNDAGKNVSYSFRIEDSDYIVDKSIRYTAKLYIDTSGDGYYSADEVASNKKLISPNRLVTISTSLDSDYKGVLCWKLVVNRTGDSSIRDEKTGVTAIENSTGVKEKIRILQINTVPHQYDWTRNTLDLEYELAHNHGGYFAKYLNALNDFEVTIHTITVDQFRDGLPWARGGKTYSRDSIINDYDMLIFGFGDSYKDIESTRAMESIQAYIDSGQSVLFTHDTTSQNNEWGRNENNLKIITDSGFYFNQFMRTSMGMNRFGVLPVGALPNYADNMEKSRYISAIATVNNNISAEKLKANRIFDSATMPSNLSGAGSTYPEIQGFTYTALMQYTHIPRALTSSGDGWEVGIKGPYRSLKVNSKGQGGFPFIERGYQSFQITKTNEGQVTQYPYEIPDQVGITETHGQYYQLNMEDPELVVWYCLSDGEMKGSEKAWYSSSPNDVSNNYYIYNKGNITYSGVGHRSISGNENEAKLFINTMIAAYKTSINNPEVTITNGSYDEGTSETYIYSIVSAGEVISNTAVTPVTFRASSNNTAVNTLYVQIYNESGQDVTDMVKLLDPVGHEVHKNNLTYNGSTIVVKAMEASKDSALKEYTLMYPLVGLATSSKVKFTIKVFTQSFATGEAKGALVQTTLFDLD